MPDQRNTLQSMFVDGNRYPNFGEVIVKMHVQGFRCHTNTVIDIASPITAFCGLNGTGKSTLLHLAGVAFRQSVPDRYTFYVKDFILVGKLDPKPFTPTASVTYDLWQPDRKTRSVRLYRDDQRKRWQGYRSRSKRVVFFAGVGFYLPKVEKRDYFVRNSAVFNVHATVPVDPNNKQWTSKILGCAYESILSNSVNHAGKKGKVISVERRNSSYSEANMGYGEGRTQLLINSLENLPEKSLVLLEEPEISLHPSAQHDLAKYLIDLAIRKKHQILLTTHSEFILEALPSPSRIFLKASDNGIETLPGLTALQAKSLMTDGRTKALAVLVEDRCSAVVLRELVRRVDGTYLETIGIYPAGDENRIATVVRALRGTGFQIAAVKDGDKQAAPNENIFKLPGIQPPEKELFGNAAVKTYLQNTYHVDMNNFQATIVDVDHHDWIDRLAERINGDPAGLMSEMARVYAQGLLQNDVDALTNQLKEASRR